MVRALRVSLCDGAVDIHQPRDEQPDENHGDSSELPQNLLPLLFSRFPAPSSPSPASAAHVQYFTERAVICEASTRLAILVTLFARSGAAPHNSIFRGCDAEVDSRAALIWHCSVIQNSALRYETASLSSWRARYSAVRACCSATTQKPLSSVPSGSSVTFNAFRPQSEPSTTPLVMDPLRRGCRMTRAGGASIGLMRRIHPHPPRILREKLPLVKTR